MKNLQYSTVFAIIIILTVFNPSKCLATHFLGSEMTWQCVGQDSFIVTLTLYRDCNGVNMGNANITFKCKSTGSTITSKNVSRPAPTDITPTCDETCTRCESAGCSFPYGIHRFTYNTGLVILSRAGSCCDILMIFQGCCRNSSITTGLNDKQFYCDAALNRCLTPCDNSPVFTHTPLTYICIGQEVFFNLGAIDTDKDSNTLLDSLTYEFTPPLGYNANSLAYSTPYSYDKPIFFWGFPYNNLPFPRGLHLDPNTGNIQFRPMKIESTVLSYIVKEFRNGVLIGIIRRDVQLIVINCPNNHPPVLSGPYFKEVRAGNLVSFNINSNDYDPADSVTLQYGQEISGASWYDNNGSVLHPTGTFNWEPTISDISPIPHKFSVTVSDNACPIFGKTSRIYEILVKSDMFVNLGNDTIVCNSSLFTLTPQYFSTFGGIRFRWSTSTNDTMPKNSLFVTKDTTISVMITDSIGRIQSDTINITVKPRPDVQIDSTSDVLCFGKPYSLEATYKNADGVLWYKDNNKADGTFKGSVTDTTIIYNPGTADLARLYFWLNIETTHNDNICPPAYDSIRVNMSDSPIPDFDVSGTTPLTVHFSDSSTINLGNITKYEWSFDDGNTSNQKNPTHTFDSARVYFVTLCVTSDAGCDSCITKDLWINDKWGVGMPEVISAISLKIKPNPADNQVVISIDKSNCQMESVYLINSSGQLVRKYQTVTDSKLNINKDELSPGIYFIMAFLISGEVIYGKFMFE